MEFFEQRVQQPSRQRKTARAFLAFAERILPRASELWVQASLDYRQRLAVLSRGNRVRRIRFNRTAATAPFFKYLAPSVSADEKMVSRNFASWNHRAASLRAVDSLRCA